MAIALTNIGVNQTSSGTSISVTVPAGGVPAGALINVHVTSQAAIDTRTRSVADSSSNSYSEKIKAVLAGSLFTSIFSAFNVTALSSGNTITFSISGSAAVLEISVYYATGIQTSSDPNDATVNNTATVSSGDVTITAAAAPAVAGSLIVAHCSINIASLSFTQDGNGWSDTPPSFTSSGGRWLRGGVKVSSAQETWNPSTNTVAYAAVITAYKPTPSANPFFTAALPSNLTRIAPPPLVIPPNSLLGGLAGKDNLPAAAFAHAWPNPVLRPPMVQRFIPPPFDFAGATPGSGVSEQDAAGMLVVFGSMGAMH